MTWSDMVGASGGNALATLGSYIQADKDAKEKRAWQAYNNKMVRLQNAQNQNAINVNERLAIERSSLQEFNIRKSELLTVASVEVAAAASGTVGNSVNRAIFDVQRNAAVASANRQRDLDAQFLAFDQQRVNSAMSAELSLNREVIPSPNPATYLLGFGSDMVGEYRKK